MKGLVDGEIERIKSTDGDKDQQIRRLRAELKERAEDCDEQIHALISGVSFLDFQLERAMARIKELEGKNNLLRADVELLDEAIKLVNREH